MEIILILLAIIGGLFLFFRILKAIDNFGHRTDARLSRKYYSGERNRFVHQLDPNRHEQRAAQAIEDTFAPRIEHAQRQLVTARVKASKRGKNRKYSRKDRKLVDKQLRAQSAISALTRQKNRELSFIGKVIGSARVNPATGETSRGIGREGTRVPGLTRTAAKTKNQSLISKAIVGKKGKK